MAQGMGDVPRHRAKVYCLNEDGQWDDKGTGHATVQYIMVRAAASHQCSLLSASDRGAHLKKVSSSPIPFGRAPGAQADESAFISLISEESGEHLVRARVHMDENIYQRQQDTILSWNEPETGIDYALSFQEPDGCTELWEQICSLQGRSADERAAEAQAQAASVQQADQMADAEAAMAAADHQLQLPAAEMRNLAAIAELLTEVPMMRRSKLAEMMLAKDYIPQLIALFATVEDLEATEDLHRLFAIFKGIVMLNNTTVYETLLREDMLMGVVGALEYDPELICHETHHRQFLRETAKFRSVVPFGDASVLKRVHQNFHLGFLKDVVLPRALDDNTFAALNQLQFFNNVQIVSSLTNDQPFLAGLRAKLAAEETASADELLDALRLLQELCTIAKSLQLYHRAAFYRRVVEHGYFLPLAAFLTRPEPALRLAAIEVLLASTLHDPSLLRTHVLQQKPESVMLRGLLRVLTSDEASGEKPQITEVLRALLDPEGMEGREQDDFLNLFYENHVHELAQPVAGKVDSGTGPMKGSSGALAASCKAAAPAAAAAAAASAAAPEAGSSSSSSRGAAVAGATGATAATTTAATADGSSSGGGGSSSAGACAEVPEGVLSARQHVCELLCFCVAKHSYRIKYFILRNNILAKVLKLASHRDKCLVLASIRFFRTCIGLKDEFYNRYIMKNKCFELVFTQLYANRTRDNLLHSSILELFEFVRKENIKSLIAHIVENYRDKLTPLTHSDIFKGLVVRHDQNEDFKSTGGGGGLPGGLPPGGAGGPGGPGGGGGPGMSIAPGGGLTFGPRRAPSVYLSGRRAFPDEDDDSAYFNASDDDDDDEVGAPSAADGDGSADGATAMAPTGSDGGALGAMLASSSYPAPTFVAASSVFDVEGRSRDGGALDESRGLLGGLVHPGGGGSGLGGGLGSGGFGGGGGAMGGGAMPLVHQREHLARSEAMGQAAELPRRAAAAAGSPPTAQAGQAGGGGSGGDDKENAATVAAVSAVSAWGEARPEAAAERSPTGGGAATAWPDRAVPSRPRPERPTASHAGLPGLLSDYADAEEEARPAAASAAGDEGRPPPEEEDTPHNKRQRVAGGAE